MQSLQNARLETLHHVEAFLDENASRLPGLTLTGVRKSLGDAVAELDALARGQAGNNISAKSTTQQLRALRQVLIRDHMAKIAGIAAVSLPATPQLEPLRMPKERLSESHLSLAALAMAETAEKHQAVFVAAGLPEDFIARLVAAADAMIEALRQRSQSVTNRTGATVGMNTRLLEARKLVVAIDRFVLSDLKHDPVLLAAWKSAKRVHRASRQVVPPIPAPVPTSAPASVPVLAPATAA